MGKLPVRVAPTATISTLPLLFVLLKPALQKATTPFPAEMPSLPLLAATELVTLPLATRMPVVPFARKGSLGGTKHLAQQS